MNWATYFTSNREISAEQTRTYLNTRPPGSFQLIDVRQPTEYEQGHIPGAILLPVGELLPRLTEIDPQRETIVYCRSGVRSTAACQILRDNSFEQVLNMTGGILGWQGHRAEGGENLGLGYFIQTDFPSALAMAYRMEDGLQELYLHLATLAERRDNQLFLESLAQMEDGHKAKLRAQHRDRGGDIDLRQDEAVAEGGLDPTDFSARFAIQLGSIEGILELAMMFETQAYDLYSRLARQHQGEPKDFFLKMAGEELNHLAKLSRQLDNRLA